MNRDRGRWRRLSPWRIAGILGTSLLAAAGQSDSGRAQPLVAVYDALWAGIPAARIRLELGGDGARYQDAIVIRTDGLLHLVTRFRASATADGSVGLTLSAEPQHYDAVYDLRKRRGSRVSMRFVVRSEGVIAERGLGDTSRKPPLGEGYRRDAVDPLSALERIRERLRAALQRGGNSFSIPVFDGARRFDLRGRVLPISGDGRSLQIVLTFLPIAGFKGELSDDGDPDDAPRPARLVVSDDARLLPMSFEVQVFNFPLVVRLDHLCQVPLACAL